MAAAGNWTLTNTARTKILNGQFVSTDTYKCALFLSTSNIGAASTTYAAATNEVSNANGYTTGGVGVAFTLAGTTSVTGSFTTNPSWTATSSGITARFAVIYEVSGDVFAFCLLDSTPADVTVSAGNVLTIDSDGVPAPVYTLA